MVENEEMKRAEEQYSANSIQVLEGLEAVFTARETDTLCFPTSSSAG